MARAMRLRFTLSFFLPLSKLWFGLHEGCLRIAQGKFSSKTCCDEHKHVVGDECCAQMRIAPNPDAIPAPNAAGPPLPPGCVCSCRSASHLSLHGCDLDGWFSGAAFGPDLGTIWSQNLDLYGCLTGLKHLLVIEIH